MFIFVKFMRRLK